MTQLGEESNGGSAPVGEVEKEGSWRESSWTFSGLRKRIYRSFTERPIRFVIVLAIVFLAAFVFRNLAQPMILSVRIYFGAVIFVALFVVLGWLAVRKRTPRWRALGSIAGFALGFTTVLTGKDLHDYLTSYAQYRNMEIVDLQTLPTTDHERILPLNGVYSFIRERINENESPTRPDLVRVGEEYQWTMAISPSRIVPRLFDEGGVDEIIHISSTAGSPELSKKNRDTVSFSVGENLLLSANIENCTRRAFGFLRYFSYEPGNVLFIKDDAGAWVQVVSLIKWEGLWSAWLPWPAIPKFGGVQLIRQSGESLDSVPLIGAVHRVLRGCGEWIPPEKIKDHAFLRGQNIVAYEASRFKAESIRFQGGFLAPLQLYRQGSLRIADLPEDVNQQPFTLFFHMAGRGESKLYQYFALEPVNTQGLSTSFLVPADGIGPQFVYRHFERGESPIGVSAVGDQVRNSNKRINWTTNAPVEHRPYIRKIPDAQGTIKERFMWLTTIVTHKHTRDGAVNGKEFISGNVPDITVTDASRGAVVWVDARYPEKWPDQITSELGSLWAKDN